MQRKIRMLDLTIYGLMGLAAVLLIASVLHSLMNSHQSEIDLSFILLYFMNNAHLDRSRRTGTGTRELRLGGTVHRHG
jgi:hypothetical protein